VFHCGQKYNFLVFYHTFAAIMSVRNLEKQDISIKNFYYHRNTINFAIRKIRLKNRADLFFGYFLKQ